ncbi:MAG: type II and III secretion system protein family protein [Rhizobiaceae bacterium]|nr:type II and III secretion system protein family protein [Rhizobiaceae bacterium]
MLTFARLIIFTLVMAGLAATLPPQAHAQVIDVSNGRNITVKVAKGKPRTVRTSVPFYEIVIGDPEVANVNPLTDRSFYVLGNELGTTGIALFDENKQLVGTLDIEVTLDTDRLANTIKEAVPGNNIKVGSANGRLVLSGEANDSQAAEKAKDIAKRFSGEEEIINSVNITSSQQVQLNVRFVEINRQVGQELGTQLSAQYAFGGSSVGFNSNPQSSSNAPAGAIISRLTTGGLTVDMALRALEDRGVARRLAEPNLIARSGETASFLAGGEFPIPVASRENTITVEYKQYGVSLEFTPTVLADGLISLDIAPEVSSVDTSASYQVGNLAIPGFVVRRARTLVDLKSGQSFMIAGLLQSQNDTGTQRLPGLGKLPILGNLFSSKAYQRRETDLVIIITPYLVKPIDPSKKVRTPMDDTKAPKPLDYFLGEREELRVSQLNGGKAGPSKPARGYGHYLELN